MAHRKSRSEHPHRRIENRMKKRDQSKHNNNIVHLKNKAYWINKKRLRVGPVIRSRLRVALQQLATDIRGFSSSLYQTTTTSQYEAMMGAHGCEGTTPYWMSKSSFIMRRAIEPESPSASGTVKFSSVYEQMCAYIEIYIYTCMYVRADIRRRKWQK